MNEAIKKRIDPLLQKISSLSLREKSLVSVVALVAVVFGIFNYVVTPVYQAFQAQAARSKDLDQTVAVIPDMLGRYSRLLARRNEIDRFYEKVELRESAVPHIEKLLQDTVKLQPGSGNYLISPRQLPDFAGKYKHTTYSITFDAPTMELVVEFLKQIASGSQPMLLSQISIQKKTAGNALSVQIEVSAFERLQKAGS